MAQRRRQNRSWLPSELVAVVAGRQLHGQDRMALMRWMGWKPRVEKLVAHVEGPESHGKAHLRQKPPTGLETAVRGLESTLDQTTTPNDHAERVGEVVELESAA